jgi:hypothetical protein
MSSLMYRGSVYPSNALPEQFKEVRALLVVAGRLERLRDTISRHFAGSQDAAAQRVPLFAALLYVVVVA